MRSGNKNTFTRFGRKLTLYFPTAQTQKDNRKLSQQRIDDGSLKDGSVHE
jgi:hypothetical protein